LYQQSLIRGFITYVRPLLKYNSVIWSPYLKQDIRVEQVFAETFYQALMILLRTKFETNSCIAFGVEWTKLDQILERHTAIIGLRFLDFR